LTSRGTSDRNVRSVVVSDCSIQSEVVSE